MVRCLCSAVVWDKKRGGLLTPQQGATRGARPAMAGGSGGEGEAVVVGRDEGGRVDVWAHVLAVVCRASEGY